jgi:hypothetical protein
MPNLVDLYTNHLESYKALKPFLYNPHLTDPSALQLLHQQEKRVAQHLQCYTLTRLDTPNIPKIRKILELLRDDASTGGARLSGEDAYGLQRLMTKLTLNPQWEVGNIEDAVKNTSAKILKSVVSLYNQLCTIKGEDIHKVRIDEVGDYGGNKRVVVLMFSFAGSAQLVHTDRLEVERLEALAGIPRNPAPVLSQAITHMRSTPYHVLSSGPKAPVTSANVLANFKFLATDCKKPPRPVRPRAGPKGKDDNSDVIVEDSGVQLFSPLCAICGDSLRNEATLPRFADCTHVSTFHIACYATYIAHWTNSNSTYKPKVPKCPVYGCGWSYTAEKVITFKCSAEDFLPSDPPPKQSHPDQEVGSYNPKPGFVFVVEDEMHSELDMGFCDFEPGRIDPEDCAF